MARQKGIVKIEGTLDDTTFYKSQDGYMVKTKSEVSRDRIKTDPKYQRTRENNAEFGNSAVSGKMLRDSIHPLMKVAADNRVISRLSKTMHSILLFDLTNIRGERKVATGIATAGGKALLKGFEFNKRSHLT